MKNFDYYHRKSIQVAEKLSAISAIALFVLFGIMAVYHIFFA